MLPSLGPLSRPLPCTRATLLPNSAQPNVGRESSGVLWSAWGVGTPSGWTRRKQEPKPVSRAVQAAAPPTCVPAAWGPVRGRGAGTQGPGLR